MVLVACVRLFPGMFPTLTTGAGTTSAIVTSTYRPFPPAAGMPPIVTSRRRSLAAHPLTRIDPSDIVETTSTSHQPASTPSHARSIDQHSVRTDLPAPLRPPCKSQTVPL